jgi:hypothetical protein
MAKGSVSALPRGAHAALKTKELRFHSVGSLEVTGSPGVFESCDLFSVNAGVPVDDAEAFANTTLSTAVELLDRAFDDTIDKALNEHLAYACKVLVELGSAVYASLLIGTGTDADMRAAANDLVHGSGK